MPSGGNRRRLEELWLGELERVGVRRAKIQAPEFVPEALTRAVGQFNDAQYWDCHETLEELWLETPYPLRFFYHGVIKAAVGFHHLSRHNRNGARTKLSDAVRLLSLFQPEFLGLRTDLLSDDVSTWLVRLESSDRADWVELDALERPVIWEPGGIGRYGP